MFKTTYGKPQWFMQSGKYKTKCSFLSSFMHEEEIKIEEILNQEEKLTSFRDYFKVVMELMYYNHHVSREISVCGNPLANLQVHKC